MVPSPVTTAMRGSRSSPRSGETARNVGVAVGGLAHNAKECNPRESILLLSLGVTLLSISYSYKCLLSYYNIFLLTNKQ